MQAAEPPQSTDRLSGAINTGVEWATRHWTLFVNGAVAIYIGLAFSAPLLMMAGLDGPARLIYLIFHATCHQLPQRSFFLDGPAIAYSFDEIAPLTGATTGLDLFWHPIYDASLGLGYQVAFCQRDTAIYLSILVTGILYAVTGRRWRPLPWWGLVLCTVPIALDGLSQLPGWRESVPALRVLTGAIFGVGVVLFAYPRLNTAMREIGASAADSASTWQP